ncbi:MAG: 2-hydroxy-3-oxopropionate reductase [Armatimonadota bacterium]|nr:MAG: 2-hydroxy-3-oxopropionate reductase [Armatimonadota bacterium]
METAAESDVVVLSLPGSAAVLDVVLGSKGIAESLPAGSVVVDTGTTEPSASRRIAAALAEKSIGFLDAPVSGGQKAAIEGTLSFMVGGDEAVFQRCLPVLRTMGSSVVRMGESGSGSVAKLVNNLIVGAQFAAIAEGFTLAVKSGLDTAVLYQAIRAGWAQSKVLDVSADAFLRRDFRPGGSVDIHWKDLGYALSLAKDVDVPTPVTAIVHEIFKAARAGGKGRMAQPAIVMLWEELLNIQVGKQEDEQTS